MTLKMRDELKSGRVASWYNANVIAVLQRENISATLFLTGLWIEAYPEITKQLSQNPLFELGNHSYSHDGFRSPCYGLPAVKKSNESAEASGPTRCCRNMRSPTRNTSASPGCA